MTGGGGVWRIFSLKEGSGHRERVTAAQTQLSMSACKRAVSRFFR